MKLNKVEKKVRKAAKCYLIKEDKVLVTRYKEKNLKAGYYDIPGGKIEDGELATDAAIREVKEETDVTVKNLKYSGNLIVEYPNRIFDFDIFVTNDFEGTPKNFEANEAFMIEIEELLKKEKVLSNILLLDRFFINGLIDEETNFNMYIRVEENENILEVKYLYK